MTTELDEVQREINKLRRERAYLQELRKAKVARLGEKLKNVPEKFGERHPILAETFSALKTGAIKTGKFLYENKVRADSNSAFSKTLNVGQTELNPQTNQYITRTMDSYKVVSTPFKRAIKV